MVQNKTEIVKNYISTEIKEGRIREGHRLPSCRKIGELLSINKITVNKAYSELEKEHKVYSIPRGGFYLIKSEECIKEIEKTVDFRTVKPDNRLVPYREFTHVMNKAIDMYQSSLFGYETTGGLSSLRDTLKSRFETEGIYTETEMIMITNGAQQAIALVLQTLFRNIKSKLLVEAPTYNLVIKLATYLGIDMVEIVRSIDGFDYKEMETIFKSGEIKAFYIMPRHQNPTGYTLSEKDKKRIVELACKYNVVIIEDDYLADLGSGKGCLPIHYYDTNKETVYIRSFSKTFMPGIRIGAAVIPKFMLKEFVSLKNISDLNTSSISQAALDLFIKSGMYDKHIKKVRKIYEAKLRKAAEIFKTVRKEGFYWNVPEHGIFIWIQLPEYIEAVEIEKELQKYGILVKNGAEFFLDKGVEVNKNCIRLCIAGVPEGDMNALATLVFY
ncbi:MAG: GntR family transcriptional regulator [Clostridiales bacterium]|jgi:DNA-binding transcriptional MocR family regulator|nr:GntR family transcriptional regulator [Clostridiales bacterium]